jgi:hypothetical protein
MTRYRWVHDPDDRRNILYDVGILADGSLHNPNRYDADLVRRAVQVVEAARQARRREAAQKAVATKVRWRQVRLDKLARDYIAGRLAPGDRCRICRRAITDEISRQRGIGPECWQDLLCRCEGLDAV